MKTARLYSFLTLFCISLFSLNASAAEYSVGKHYTQLGTPQADGGSEQVEVIEFFWYGCPHCYNFEPHVNKWLDKKPANVKFTRVPAVFRPSWQVHAQAYYALETLGAVDQAHEAIFNATHRDKKSIDTPEAIAAIVAKEGVDPEAFKKAMRSFTVQVKVKQAAKMLRAYQVNGVPAVAVNGRYKTSGREAGNYPTMTKIMDYLVEQEAQRKNITLK